MDRRTNQSVVRLRVVFVSPWSAHTVVHPTTAGFLLPWLVLDFGAAPIYAGILILNDA